MKSRILEFKDSKIAWIGQIPKHWEVTKNKYILNGVYSGGTPTSGTTEFYTDEDDGIPFVSIGDMSKKEFIESTKAKVTKLGILDKNLRILPKNTILYSIYATIGEVTELKCSATISQALLALFVKNSYNKQFYKYNLKAMKDYIFFQSSGTTQFNLNAKKVLNFSFVLPPLDEQEKIAEFLDKKCEIIDKRLENLEQKISALKEYKKSLISECVTKGLNSRILEFKDSKIPWIGKIPKHWEVSKIKYVVSKKITDGTHQTPEYADENTGSPFLSAKDVTSGYINWENIKYITKSLHNQLQKEVKPQKDDILLAKNGTTGIAALVTDDKIFDIYVTLALIRANKNIVLPKFLLYIINSELCKIQFNLSLIGIGVQNLHLNLINNTLILLPPLDEQKEIAEFLDKKCASIDKLSANYQSQIHALKEYKKSLIYECVTGKKEIKI